MQPNTGMVSDESLPPPRLVHFLDSLVRPTGGLAAALSILLIAVLLLAVLLAPPVSLAARISEAGYQQIGKEGGHVTLADGSEFAIPPEGVLSPLPVRVTILPVADFAAKAPPDLKEATTIPPRLSLRSAVYALDTRGRQASDVRFSMRIPTGVRDEELTRVDLYAWNGSEWIWQPTIVVDDDDLIYTTLPSLPQAVALFVVSAPRTTVAATLSPSESLPEASADVVSEVSQQGLWVDADGSLRGSLDDLPPLKGARYQTVPTVQNLAGDRWDGDLISNILQNRGLRRAHIANLAALADKPLYAGVNIDYRRLPATLEDQSNFLAFLSELATELHNRRKLLVVTLESPQRISDDPRPEFAWDTGGYDWVSIGRVADTVRVLVAADAGDQLSSLSRTLQFATTQVSRQKLQPALATSTNVVSSKGLRAISYSEALAMAVAIERADAPQPVVAGEGKVTVRLTYLTVGDTATAFFWDSNAKQYRFAFKDNGGVGTVWLQNAASLSHLLAATSRYAAKGVVLRDPSSQRVDPGIWDALRAYVATGQVTPTEPDDAQMRINWLVSGGQMSSGMSATEMTWQAPKEPGQYTLSAALPAPLAVVGAKSAQSLSIEVIAPTPIPTPTATRAPTPTPAPVVVAPTATKAAAAPAPAPAASAVGKYGFGYGIQAHMIHNDHGPIINAIAGMGFGWVKQQVEWINYEPSKGNYNWGELDRVANSASGAGIKVLFSILRSPKWANSDPDGPPRNFNDLGDFLAAMATRYKGKVQAYEVWNEQNLGREWKGHTLSASKYVELLRIAYQRIKAADPDAVVVAGALTPTGWNDGVVAIDDRLYLRQMYDAGLKSVCDAVGIHPSGFANPPDALYPEPKPSAPSHNNHPSFYYRNTMEDYRNIMVEYGDSRKQLWPTEFGWAVSAKPEPGYEYAAYNNESTRAQWIVRAYQMGKSWGWVGPMFLWNLNFRLVAPGTEMAAFVIMDPGWRATPAYAALRDMPK